MPRPRIWERESLGKRDTAACLGWWGGGGSVGVSQHTCCVQEGWRGSLISILSRLCEKFLVASERGRGHGMRVVDGERYLTHQSLCPYPYPLILIHPPTHLQPRDFMCCLKQNTICGRWLGESLLLWGVQSCETDVLGVKRRLIWRREWGSSGVGRSGVRWVCPVRAGTGRGGVGPGFGAAKPPGSYPAPSRSEGTWRFIGRTSCFHARSGLELAMPDSLPT